MSRDPVISGVGMTRFGQFLDRGVRSLAVEAVDAALSDANTPADDVGIVFFANALSGLVTGQESIRGQVALLPTGLQGKPIVNVDNACASGSTAVHLAAMAVRSGMVDVALAVGAEKLTHSDRQVTMRAFASAVDVEAAQAAQAAAPSGHSTFMDIYAESARQYMAVRGGVPADFAQVVVKSRTFGSLNPHAQFQKVPTLEEVLGSREIAAPLTLFMCSPVGDGAAAVVVCTPQYAARAGASAVRIRASALQSGADHEPRAFDRACAIAYEAAGLGPADLHVVELHDAAAPAELMYYEELGLCALGDGPSLLRSGATSLGGSLPVNPSGGLLSRGHPVGATGCGQIVELVEQLRGRCGARQREGARIGLAQNSGGSLGADVAAATVIILETA